jgi:hypothetical protein
VHIRSSASSATATSGGSSGSNSGASSSSPSTTAIVAGVVGGLVLIGALVIGAFFFLRRRRATAHRRHPLDGGYDGVGLGKVGSPVPGQNVPFSASEEATPFVTSGAQTTPYMDNPPYQYSTHSNTYSTATSDATLGPAMQSRSSTYSAAPNTPPPVLSYATQQNLGFNAVTSPPSTSASFDPYAAYAGGSITPSGPSFDPYAPYAAGSIAPSGPSEGTSALPIAGAVYAARAGSVAESAPEAGPSSGRFAVANPSPPDVDEKLGPEPPQARETVYQHEDISDVTELPPAYKERVDH